MAEVEGAKSDKSLPPPQVESNGLPEGEATTPEVSDEVPKEVEVVDHVVERESWDSKVEYFLTLIGYAVGFGNIWRFPYLLHSNGGVAFLIPYFLMLAFEGIPLFFLELALGQRLRKGAVGAWTEISPYLGGVGLAMGMTCYLVVVYYNTLVAYVISYMVDSFRGTLAWTNCETATKAGTDGVKDLTECMMVGANQVSKYYWYRRTLDISESITNAGNWNWYMMLYIALSWLTVWGILIKGIKSSGKVVYFTALFPYMVLLCFFIGNFFLEGWQNGFTILFKPDFGKLLEVKVWLTAGTQIFFSLGVAYGCLIVFASYLPSRNNCYKDAVSISCINCFTSVIASIVIFPILGSQGTRQFNLCKEEQRDIFAKHVGVNEMFFKEYKIPESGDDGIIMEYYHNDALVKLMPPININLICNLEKEVRDSGGGTGLVFIAFAGAALNLPVPQFWCFLFFFMLFTLGIDSSFGTCEGAISAVEDLKLLKQPRWVITTVVIGSLWICSNIFALGWGSYVQVFLDQFVANWTLLIIAFFEMVGIAWVYGLAKFSYDIKLMTGTKPNAFMLICWKWISPLIIFVILVLSIVDQFRNGYQYERYNSKIGGIENVQYPPLIIFAGYVLWLASIAWVPIQATLAYFGRSLIKPEEAASFPEDELREERHFLTEQDDLDQFDTLDRLVMGKSVEDFMAYRGKSVSSIPPVNFDGPDPFALDLPVPNESVPDLPDADDKQLGDGNV